ncbi:MAG: fumarylacetoacetate hydrolase family protein [Acidobacteria bacterium]|nr:fumarylacetoacetate hydrolase family protein [Acidobacteriota bacterium]
MNKVGVEAGEFGEILQVIGVAHAFRTSLAVRRHLTRDTAGHHSSQHGDFSYFFKGDARSLVGHGRAVRLRTDPAAGGLARHWPEPELAVLLGERHEVLAVTLANDLTAVSLEVRGRTEQSDGTYLGKAWRGSGSLGPRFLTPEEVGDLSDLTVGLRVSRGGRVVYDRAYSTSRSVYPPAAIPGMIVACRRGYGDRPPPSKRIAVGDDDFLRPGTVLMLGTGLVTEGRYYCEPGDVLSVYSPRIGTLTNVVAAETASAVAPG